MKAPKIIYSKINIEINHKIYNIVRDRISDIAFNQVYFDVRSNVRGEIVKNQVWNQLEEKYK